MRRLVLPLLLLLAISCTTASTVKTPDPNTTASTADFDVRIVKTIFTEEFHSDGRADARVIVTVRNNTTEPYELERIHVQGMGGRYYVPLDAHDADRTIAPGATEAFNFRVTAIAPQKVTAEPLTVHTTIEARVAGGAALREERFSARVRPLTVNPRNVNGWEWNYNVSVISAMDYPPLSLYNPADYHR